MKVFRLLSGDGEFEPSWLTPLNWAWVNARKISTEFICPGQSWSPLKSSSEHSSPTHHISSEDTQGGHVPGQVSIHGTQVRSSRAPEQQYLHICKASIAARNSGGACGAECRWLRTCSGAHVQVSAGVLPLCMVPNAPCGGPGGVP